MSTCQVNKDKLQLSPRYLPLVLEPDTARQERLSSSIFDKLYLFRYTKNSVGLIFFESGSDPE